LERYDWTSLSEASDPLPESELLLVEALLSVEPEVDAAVVAAGGGVDEVVGAGCSILVAGGVNWDVLVEEGCSSVEKVVGGGGTNVELGEATLATPEDEDAINAELLEMVVGEAEGAENVAAEDEVTTVATEGSEE